MKFVLILVCFGLLLSSAAEAGSITSGLTERYSGVSANETLPTLIVLSARPNALVMQDKLMGFGTALGPTHQQIMDSLRSTQTFTQPGVMHSLEILQGQNMAKNARGFWIANVIAADLTSAGAELIANMAEVSEVGLDEDVIARSIANSTPATAPTGNADHLDKISAPPAWDLGVRGDNRTICILADGVDGNQTALTSHWRGKIAPPEQCWRDADHSSSPTSCGDVGTAMAGAAVAENIGVAPGAQWIAAKLVCDHTRLSDVLATLQWAADPDENSASFADVPDAICSAWGLNDACGAAAPADIWDAVDNVEALGPIVVFASGSDGSGSSTELAPESRAVNFAVGAVDATGATILAQPTSARGQSSCDASIKPDIVAPGTDVVTTGNSGYVHATGTPVAAAQVAGTVALMRQANTNLTPHDIKRILGMTATDLGTPKEDNIFGHGILNVRAAVELAQSARGSGSIEGQVSYGGTPIAGAHVVVKGEYGELTAVTDFNGTYRFDHLATETPYTIEAGRFGYKYYVHDKPVSISGKQATSVYIDLARGIEDDVEHDQGWQLGVDSDNARSGIWERAIPKGTKVNGTLAEPDENASADGQYCFVTGAAPSADVDASAYDVDGGKTTLCSPIFNVSELTNPVLHFSYWYSNDLAGTHGGDFFRAQISNDGGTTWKNLINTSASTTGWKKVSVKLADFVTATDQMQLQFIADDDGPESLVEAAVDDISIVGAPNVPEPPRDLLLSVQFDQVVLTWKGSADAAGYRIYMSNYPDDVVKPEHLFTTTNDTTLTVPISSIPYNQFYFQVTAIR